MLPQIKSTQVQADPSDATKKSHKLLQLVPNTALYKRPEEREPPIAESPNNSKRDRKKPSPKKERYKRDRAGA